MKTILLKKERKDTYSTLMFMFILMFNMIFKSYCSQRQQQIVLFTLKLLHRLNKQDTICLLVSFGGTERWTTAEKSDCGR